MGGGDNDDPYFSRLKKQQQKNTQIGRRSEGRLFLAPIEQGAARTMGPGIPNRRKSTESRDKLTMTDTFLCNTESLKPGEISYCRQLMTSLGHEWDMWAFYNLFPFKDNSLSLERKRAQTTRK